MRQIRVMVMALNAAVLCGLPSCSNATVPDNGSATTLEATIASSTDGLGSPGIADLPDADVPLPADFPLSIPRPESGAIEETSESAAPGGEVTEDWVTYVVPGAQLGAVVSAYRARLDAAGFSVLATNDKYGEAGDQVELQLDHVPPARVVFAQTGASVSVAVLVAAS